MKGFQNEQYESIVMSTPHIRDAGPPLRIRLPSMGHHDEHGGVRGVDETVATVKQG